MELVCASAIFQETHSLFSSVYLDASMGRPHRRWLMSGLSGREVTDSS